MTQRYWWGAMTFFGCQLDSVWEDKAASFGQAHALFEKTPPVPGSLVVLPEMFATGFSTQTQRTRQGNPPECDAFLKSLAQRHQAAVIGGVVGTRASRELTNDAVAFDGTGQELCRYSKIQPFSGGGELAIHTPGREIRTFHWGGFTVCPLICYDLRFPELFRAGARRGATLFVVMASWPVMRDRHWQTLLQARAIENQAYVIGVNRCGRDPNFYHSGRSCLVDPQGVIIADAGEGQKVFRGELDPETVANWRRDFPALRDMGWRDPLDA